MLRKVKNHEQHAAFSIEATKNQKENRTIFPCNFYIFTKPSFVAKGTLIALTTAIFTEAKVATWQTTTLLVQDLHVLLANEKKKQGKQLILVGVT